MKVPLAAIFAGLSVLSRLVAAAPEVSPLSGSQQPGSDIESLVRELGDESFRVREKATREIWELGDAALPALKEAVGSTSPEQAIRARDLLRKIQLDISPETDPAVTALVERYHKASLSEKSGLFGKLKAKRAWRQMLKLYASETQADLREKLAPAMNGIAVRAARERLLMEDAKGAREYLEMAPADAEGLLALAEYHRSHGTLDAELARAKVEKGRKAGAWRLALERAAGDLQGAREAAEVGGEPRIAAAMAALAGDPLLWLRGAGDDADEDPISATYARVAVKRWLGKPVREMDIESLTRDLDARSARRSGDAMKALFLLGEVDKAEVVFAKSEPLSAFRHFESLERIPEALKALGLDTARPDYQPWVATRIAAMHADDVEDQHGVADGNEELVALANFLERRGLNQEAFDTFSGPLAELAEKDEGRFADFLRELFGNSESLSGAPLLATRIGLKWAGENDRRWDDLVVAAFGDDEQSSSWWDWLAVLGPKISRADRLRGMLALYGIGADPGKLREHWLSLAWKAAGEAPGEARVTLIARISELVNQTGDVKNSFRAWEQLPEESRKAVFWGQHVLNLSALERWDDAAAVIIRQIADLKNSNQESGSELHAYAAAALRRAGHEEEAVLHDNWADKLALGSPSLAMRIGNGYAYGCDYKRAGEWWERAARESDPDSGEFALAMKLHADELLEQGCWKEAAAVSEVVARIYAGSEFRWTGTLSPLPFMRQRLQADTARALANLEPHRAESIAVLDQCHRTFASDGSLADFFFPSLRKVGLMEEHDHWFRETWAIMGKVIQAYPESDNTRNTAAWFAARARMELDTAGKYLAEAIAENPYQSAYLDTMAEIQFARGNRKKALEWSRLAVNFAPVDTQLRRQQDRFRHGPLPGN